MTLLMSTVLCHGKVWIGETKISTLYYDLSGVPCIVLCHGKVWNRKESLLTLYYDNSDVHSSVSW